MNLYKICTNDYDDNEYLAIKYIWLFTMLPYLDIFSYDVCSVMFIDKQKR